MSFYLSLAGAVMAALSLVLHAVASKSPKMEVIAEDIDKVLEAVKPVLPQK
jgi:hypothetical protein